MRVLAKRRQLRAWLIGRSARSADRLFRRKPAHRSAEPGSVQRILVVKPCCLGDVLMATPALRALKLRYPRADIDVLTTEWSAVALLGNPRISRVLRYPDRPKFARIASLARRLRREKYDIGISLDRSPIANALLALAGIPERAGIDNKGRGVGLTHRVNPRPRQHETELYLDVIETLGVPPQGVEPEYVPSEAARERAREILPRSDGPLVVIHPGGAVNPGSMMISKRWPATSFGELASLLGHQLGASVVLVGSASDRPVVETTKDFADVPLLDLCDKLSFQELAAVCAEADLYVGNDSGVSHLAAAVGTPTVTVFGPTSPALYRPLGPHAVVCAPEATNELIDSGDLRDGLTYEWRLDIARISARQVLQACIQVLERETGGIKG
jgi:lipopolysaccharide heptosyltransferase II